MISGSSQLANINSAQCRDNSGKLYEDGMHYMPGPGNCLLCICDNGQPKGCKIVLCEVQCKSFEVKTWKKNCCEVVCFEDKTFNDSNTDFGI